MANPPFFDFIFLNREGINLRTQPRESILDKSETILSEATLELITIVLC